MGAIAIAGLARLTIVSADCCHLTGAKSRCFHQSAIPVANKSNVYYLSRKKEIFADYEGRVE